jgi:hypothetical protein
MTNRSRITTLLTAAVAAVVALSSPASAQPSLGTPTLSCGTGTVTTTAPGGTASQGLVGSTTADALWMAALMRWSGSRWDLVAWSQPFTTSVASNAGPSLGSTWGYLGAWRQEGAFSTTSAVTFRAAPGYWYAVVNGVMDSDGVSWATSWTPAGSYFCRA